MPGTARKHQLQGSLIYHVINRGNRRDEIFHYPEDYKYFIRLLSDYSDKFEALLYHWVVMPNHYHLLLEIEYPEKLSKMMAGIARSYVHYYQKNYNVGGHIWQGRFKSQPVEKEAYLLRCGRYIERNPVEAKMVDLAEEYVYSSAGFYVCGKPGSLTTENPAFESFGNDLTNRRKKYAEFLKTFDEEGKILFKDEESPVGSDIFKSKLIYRQSRFMPRRKGRIREQVALSV